MTGSLLLWSAVAGCSSGSDSSADSPADKGESAAESAVAELLGRSTMADLEGFRVADGGTVDAAEVAAATGREPVLTEAILADAGLVAGYRRTFTNTKGETVAVTVLRFGDPAGAGEALRALSRRSAQLEPDAAQSPVPGIGAGVVIEHGGSGSPPRFVRTAAVADGTDLALVDASSPLESSLTRVFVILLVARQARLL